MVQRIDSMLEKLKDKGLDSVFITSKANIFYFSNYLTEPHERLVALYADHTGNIVLIVPAMEEQDALAAGWKEKILTYSDQDNPWELFSNFLNDTNPESIGMEKDHVTVERLEHIQAILPNTEVVDAKDVLANIRVIKDKKEYTLLKQASELADFGVETGVRAIQEGKSELEIIAEIEYALKKKGIREMSFQTMVLSGSKTASPHGNPGLDKIKTGDLVLFDLGVVHEGYCSDITRTVAYKQINEQQKNIYQTVLEAQKKAIQAANVEDAAGKMDQTARSYISENGYGDYFTHRIGHGIGVDVHEYPSLTATNDLVLKEGMSFTIEPGIYYPGVGGVRIEDALFMTKKGAEVLNKYPKELQIID